MDLCANSSISRGPIRAEHVTLSRLEGGYIIAVALFSVCEVNVDNVTLNVLDVCGIKYI